MFRILLVLFIIIPFVEVSILIKVGSVIGAWPTISLVVFMAFAGATLMRLQGLATVMRLQKALAMGQLPATEMLEGVIITMSGLMLLTPGFLTDLIGFVGLIPFTRRLLVEWILSRGIPTAKPFQADDDHPPHNPRTIEGEYRREKDD